MTETNDENLNAPVVGEDSPFHESKGNNFSVPDYLSFLFDTMAKYEASDIYLTYGETPIFRIGQDALRMRGVAVLSDPVLLAFKDILIKGDDLEYFNEEQSVDLGCSIHGRRFRVNASLQRGHIMIVARLLAQKVPTIDEMKLPPILKKLSHCSGGIIFVSGPTGSGKSTTLAAMVEEVNQTRYKHIITIEDPIEYIFEPKKCVFEQKQLGKDVPNFATAMKYAVRQRPDVLLFGEARDPESLRNAMSLAETGHLVLTTIHSRSAEQAINRIISMFPSDEQAQVTNHLSENMIAIIIQKLVKRKDGKGVVAVHEILLNNTPVANTIRENKLNQIDNVIFTSRNIGMQLLDDSLVEHVLNGDITIQTALENCRDQGAIKRGLEKAGISFS